MARTVDLTDPRFEPKARRNPLERLALRFIKDERDLPFVWLSLQITLLVIPAAVLLYVPGVFRWWLAPLYWACLFFGFVDRYTLMLHNTSHRRLFKRRYKVLNLYIPWVLGPFCGQSPETYFAHHITMHHAEGNLPDDLSSTMRFQRDRFSHFLAYWARFFFLISVDLFRYEARKGRWPLIRRVYLGEFGFLAVLVGLTLVHWQATLVVFWVPWIVVRFVMMAGNWGQHAFIDPADPGNPYRSAVTCINSRYNRRCFNDGYHIGHHVLASRHWTEMPEDFERNLGTYRDEDAVVFEGLDNFTVWLFLMLRRYDVLAARFVDLREEPRTKEEIEAFLRSRVEAIDVPAPAASRGPLLGSA